MAALTEPERQKIHRALMRRWSHLFEPCAFSKADLRASVDAIDAWIDANAGTINQEFAGTFKSGATAEQKALLFSYVALTRYGDEPKET